MGSALEEVHVLQSQFENSNYKLWHYWYLFVLITLGLLASLLHLLLHLAMVPHLSSLCQSLSAAPCSALGCDGLWAFSDVTFKYLRTYSLSSSLWKFSFWVFQILNWPSSVLWELNPHLFKPNKAVYPEWILGRLLGNFVSMIWHARCPLEAHAPRTRLPTMSVWRLKLRAAGQKRICWRHS